MNFPLDEWPSYILTPGISTGSIDPKRVDKINTIYNMCHLVQLIVHIAYAVYPFFNLINIFTFAYIPLYYQFLITILMFIFHSLYNNVILLFFTCIKLLFKRTL